MKDKGSVFPVVGARHTSCVSVLHALPGLPATCKLHIQVAMSPKWVGRKWKLYKSKAFYIPLQE